MQICSVNLKKEMWDILTKFLNRFKSTVPDYRMQNTGSLKFDFLRGGGGDFATRHNP